MSRIRPWSVADIVRATDGNIFSGNSDSVFSEIFSDSRQPIPDGMFIALRGQHHDGHAYINDVIEKGVRGVMIENAAASGLPLSQWQQKGIICIGVDNTVRALGRLALYHRKRTGVKIIAVTGSNGKTTTREMTASVLSQKYRVHTPYGNYNNDIGLPLTLLKLSDFHELAVVELGMNHFGEIAALTRICDPDIGVITNIGPAHLEGVGSLDGVMKAKGELLENMTPGGQNTAILNADDPRILELSRRNPMPTVFYGCSEQARISASSVESTENGSRFILSLPDEQVPVSLAIPGAFMILNALAAASVGYVLNVPPRQIARGLELFKPVKGRMNVKHTNSGICLMDDTYNANPASTEAAIRTLVSFKGSGRAILVIGDMKELGDQSAKLHRHIGSVAGSCGLSRLYAAGEFAGQVAAGASDAGMNPADIVIGNKEEILRDLTNYLKPQDRVLVKGSRAMSMETITRHLTEI